jgi:hypothetical protein
MPQPYDLLPEWLLPWLTKERLAELGVILIPIGWSVVGLRVWMLRRALRQRRSIFVIPTNRSTAASNWPIRVEHFSRTLSQVRLRRAQWWMRPAGAMRIRLDTINGRGIVYTLGGPSWAQSMLRTSNYPGLLTCPADAVPLQMLTPKGLLVVPDEEDGDQDMDTGTWPGVTVTIPGASDDAPS